jgi:hypothetical protein
VAVAQAVVVMVLQVALEALAFQQVVMAEVQEVLQVAVAVAVLDI